MNCCRFRDGRMLALILVSIMAAPAPAQSGDAQKPDAVIEKWDQTWTLRPDGSTVYDEVKHVRLNNDRAYGSFSDPRITFNRDVDTLDILTARTRTPKGELIDVPAYSRNEVSPGDAAGWPAFANVRQMVLTFSGIEPGCLLELHTRITRRAGGPRVLAGDVRLDHRYPVLERRVSMIAPEGVPLATRITPESLASAGAPAVVEDPGAGGGLVGKTWQFKFDRETPDEGQAPPWQERAARLTFSTVPSAEALVREALDEVRSAADESPLISRLAAEWTRDKADPVAKLRALRERFAATFNFVDFDAAQRPAGPRRASDVINSAYGTSQEAAATLLALCRAAGLTVQPALLTADEVWCDTTPQRSFIKGYVLLFDDAGDTQIWSPQHGRLHRGGWAGHTVLSHSGTALQRTPLPPWDAAAGSRLVIRGNAAVAADGKLTGKLTIRARGLFVAPESLRTKDGQQARLADLTRRLLADAEVGGFSVTSLTDDELTADVDIKTSKPLPKLADAWRLTLGQDGPFMADVGLPLGSDRRVQPVRIPGPFEEQIELVVTWPAEWKVEARPAATTGPPASPAGVTQSVKVSGDRMELTRTTRVTQREIDREGFTSVRAALNALRTESARTLLLKP